MEYLSPQGLYYGTDIAQEAVDFCRKTYCRPNFVFAQNELTRVPIEGISFDFIYFGSVFTHVYPEEIRALLLEVARLLAPMGQIIADLFVDPEADRVPGRPRDGREQRGLPARDVCRDQPRIRESGKRTLPAGLSPCLSELALRAVDPAVDLHVLAPPRDSCGLPPPGGVRYDRRNRSIRSDPILRGIIVRSLRHP